MNKNETPEANVLIVGAGPTGLILAYALAKQGISLRIIDRYIDPSSHSKALAIQARTLETFKLLGIEKDFLDEGLQACHLNIHLYKRKVCRFHIHNAYTPYPFILILPQDKTEDILIKRLRDDFKIEVERATELIDLKRQARTVRVELMDHHTHVTEKVTFDYVCGCDGAHSMVRQLINLPFEGNLYEESFTLLDAHIKDGISRTESNAFLGQNDVVGIIPLDKKYHRLILAQPAQLRPPENLEEFQDLLNQHTSKPLELSDLQWMSHFRISRRIVPTMSLENVFLLGDAAHIHSPAGGQGMNLGIQDAINLAWKMALVLKDRAHPDFLESFSMERRPIAVHILRGTNLAMQELISKNPILKWIRNHVLIHLMKLSWIQRRLALAMMQIGHHYRKSPWVKGDATHTLKPGDRFPHFEVTDDKGKTHSSLDLLNFSEHTLVVVTHDELDTDDLDLLHRLQDIYHFHLKIISQIPTHEKDYFQAPLKDMKKCLDVADQGFFLVRPDGYIGLRCADLSEVLIEEYFKRS